MPAPPRVAVTMPGSDSSQVCRKVFPMFRLLKDTVLTRDTQTIHRRAHRLVGSR